MYTILTGKHIPKNIVYIHGANNSSRSFRYIQNKLPHHKILNIEYTVDTPIRQNIEKVRDLISDSFGNKPISIIGHSLGGFMAVALNNSLESLDKTVTMSAPFGGSRFVDFVRWICPDYRLFRDIRTKSPIVQEFRNLILSKPVTSFVTTAGGNPLLGEPNDGTVSISSQLSLKGPEYIKFDLSHTEILLSDRAITKIQEIVFNQ